MSYVTVNKQVAVAPYVAQKAATARMISGMALIDERTSLAELTVVFESEAYNEGARLFVDPVNCSAFAWWKKTYELDGVTFILLPEDHILLAGDPADNECGAV